MEKIGYGRHTVTGEPIVLLRDLPEILLKVNELVEENGELKRGMELVERDIKALREIMYELHKRLDNHINNHKEYAGGGRPVPK